MNKHNYNLLKNNKTLGRTLLYPRSPIGSSQLSNPSSNLAPASWWNPGTVTKGYYRGHNEAYALQILVDEGRSRIYISESD